MDKKNLKETYKLWVEYLKRSEDYKTVCQYVAQNKGQLSLAPLPDGLKGKERLVTTYLFFGDVYTKALDDIIFSIEMWKEIFSTDSSPIMDYSDLVESEIDRIVRIFKKSNKREPNINELKNVFSLSLKKSGAIYLKVEISVATREQLEKRFSKILTEQKKQLKKIPSLSPPGTSLEELELFLRVFDYRKERLDWDKILSIEPHSKKANFENTKRTFKRYLQYAKRIIKNVEKGIFPGEYYRKTDDE